MSRSDDLLNVYAYLFSKSQAVAKTAKNTADALERLDSALEIVKREPGLTAYDIAGRMAWSIRCRNWGEFPVTQKFFAVGEALAHLDYLEVRGRVERRFENEKYRYYAIAE